MKPIVPIVIYDCIHRLGYITNQPMKDVAEKICLSGLQDTQVIDYLYNSVGFVRNFYLTKTIVKIGDPELETKRTNTIV